MLSCRLELRGLYATPIRPLAWLQAFGFVVSRDKIYSVRAPTTGNHDELAILIGTMQRDAGPDSRARHGGAESSRRVGAAGRGAHYAAGGFQPGIGGLILFPFPRPTRPAASHRRFFQIAGRRVWRAVGRRCSWLSAAHPERSQKHGSAG